MQPLDSLVAELPLHSPSAEKARSATSEYRWTINPLFSQQASFDTDSSDTGYLEGYCSLLPFPPGQSSDKRDPEMNTPSRQSPNTIDTPRSWSFATNRYSTTGHIPLLLRSDLGDTQSQISENDSTHPCGRLLEEVRVVHNQVEQRYRHRVRDNINALWKVIPESSTTSQPSKAVILTRAKDHILELQQHARREKREKETLDAKVQMLEHFLTEQLGTNDIGV